MPDDIVVLLIQLLGANWNPANTLSQTPDIYSGYHTESRGPFQVILRSLPNEYPLGGAGVFGLQATGGIVQLMRGIVFVDIIAERPNTGSLSAEQLSFLGKQEVHRIIMENYHLISGYDYVSYEGANKIIPDVAERPDMFKWQVRVGYQWRYEV